MRMNLPFEWEQLDSHTWRAKVPGGWIVCRVKGNEGQYENMIFIDDKDHEWTIIEEELDLVEEQVSLAEEFAACKL